jgi:chloride channel protein, CIC family
MGNLLADRARLSDEQRRLLVACGAGPGMAAAYGVPLGGALFALEVLRGVLALRLILPALVASVIATMVVWLVVPNVPLYAIPAFPSSASVIVWAVLLGPIAGIVSVAYVRAIAWADRNRPTGEGDSALTYATRVEVQVSEPAVRHASAMLIRATRKCRPSGSRETEACTLGGPA